MPRFNKWTKPKFFKDGYTKWHWMCQHYNHLKIGKYVDIGAFTYINALLGVILEKNVQIGSHCSIYSLSTIDNKKGKIHIKQNARIGAHSTIMPGVTIGENAIIGAHSFVNIDIPSGVLAYGVPIKIIRKLIKKELATL